MRSIAIVALMLAPAWTWAQPAAKKRALLVGVSTYTKSGLADKPLPFAAPDMEMLAEELKAAGWNVTLLTSKGEKNSATRQAVLAAIDRTLQNVDAGDLILIALSGHGQQFRAIVANDDGTTSHQDEAFFCPSDGVPGEAETLIGLSEVISKLGKRGGRNMVLIDACRDDPRRSAGVEGNTARSIPGNTSVLFSCAARQQSYETNQMYAKNSPKGHGVFFHRVMKGLQGEARNEKGEVTWDRLSEYVRSTVNDDAVKWFPERAITTSFGEKVVQTPHIIGSLIGKSPVLLIPKETSPVAIETPEMLFAKGRKLLGGNKAERKQAFDLLTQSVDGGHGPAAYWLGLMYGVGFDVVKIDYRKMQQLRDIAHRGGYAPATASLAGWYLEEENGAPRNRPEGERLIALVWQRLQEEAKGGDPAAQNCLGRILGDGAGVPQDARSAAQWLAKSVQSGFPMADYNLAGVYEAAGNNELAMQLYQRAANRGDARAEYNLGMSYLNSNRSVGLQWLRKSAAQGLPHAKDKLRELGE